MFQTAGYPAHPPYFSYDYDYRTPPRTPPAAGGHSYYSPRHQTYTTSTPPPKGHTRRTTADPSSFAGYGTYSTPRKPQYAPEYASPGYYTSAKPTPQRRPEPDYVSDSDYRRRHGTWYHTGGQMPHAYHGAQQHYSTQSSRYVYEDYGEREFEYLPRYEMHETRPPPYQRHQSYHEPRADHYYYRDQVPIYTSATGEPMEHRPRPRRSSYTNKPTPHVPPPRPRTSHAHRSAPPQATAEDALRAGIPAGFSYKNWDPTEEPILLLGSAFDANSLGKWIYDWSVFYYGAASPISEIAGELWLLLIQLAGKIKRAEECMPKIRQTASRDLVDDFLEAGERLWQRFNKLLKICENYMWKAARKECGPAKNITMGKTSGCEFVDAVFGRDRELERTEKLMTGMRLWSMRFDSNCEEILRNPAA